MDSGLKLLLSPNEEVTLQRLAQGAKPEDLRKLDIARLVHLALVKWQGERVVFTSKGRERVGQVPTKKKPISSYNEDDELPPARAAALARREEEFRKMLFMSLPDKGKSQFPEGARQTFGRGPKRR